MAHKNCPDCGSPMTYQEGGYSDQFCAGSHYQEEYPDCWYCPDCGYCEEIPAKTENIEFI